MPRLVLAIAVGQRTRQSWWAVTCPSDRWLWTVAIFRIRKITGEKDPPRETVLAR